MKILSTQPLVQSRPSQRPQAAQEAAPQDSVTFGSTPRLPQVLGWTALGATPVLGAGMNLLGASADHASTGTARLNVAAAGANLGGTASLAYGLIAGNETAVQVGMGLLGFSAVTAGYSCASLL